MINIKETFLKLTSNRTPKGLEANVISLIPEFKFQKDEFDNYYYIIKKPDGTYSNTMFTSHLDTIDRGPNKWDNRRWDADLGAFVYINETNKDDIEKTINHVFDGDFVKTDEKTNLGADDKAGVTIMLNLMSEGVPGLYYFFMGEESGCVGSSSLSRAYKDKVNDGKLPDVKKCIAFDRRGYDSIITKQMGSVCCSDEFAKELANEINKYGFWFKPDDTGIYTDSAEFIDIIPECTNISVGYFSEHSITEKQDIEFLELLAVVFTQIDWDNLKVTRDVLNIKYKGKKSYNRYGWNDYDEYDEYPSYYNGTYREPVNKFESDKNTNTYSENHYVDKGKGEISKLPKKVEINDEEFDKWYLEQKNKAWDIGNTVDVLND